MLTGDTTTTTDESMTDNLNTEPVNSDNSNVNKPENIDDKAVNSVTTNDESNNQDDFAIPEKFLKEDGTPDYQKLTKSYKELEPLLGEKAQWSKEKTELEQKAQYAEQVKQQQDVMAKNFGFNSYNDFEKHQEQLQFNSQMANYEADEYAKYLNQSDNPAETRELIMLYKQHPNPELLAEIESRFTGDIHKKVGENLALVKQNIQQQQIQQSYEKEKESATQYLTDVTTQYADHFKNDAFTNMFGLAFKELGTNLDTKTFISAMDAYKDSIIKDYESSKQTNAENDNAKQGLADLNPNGKHINNNSSFQEKNILSMSEEEIKKEFNKYK
ncbi:MAG: hypothetical protein WCK67_07935 [bacterium]